MQSPGAMRSSGLDRLSVKPHAIFTEELSYITDGKSFLEKILQLLGTFSSGDGDFLHHTL